MLQDATLDLLRFQSFPLIAAAIDIRMEAILDRWQKLVRQKMPTADELTLTQLRDELPIVLNELSQTLAADDGSHFDRLKEVAQDHGQVRFHQSFNIGELLVEYGILRSVLLDEVTAHLGKDMTVAQSAALNMGIDITIRNGVMRFTSFQEQQLKLVVEAQSKTLAFLSHDLRGGLNGVLLMVEVLKRELAGETRFQDSVHDLDAMRQSILDTVATMDRFLHAERFRQGKVQPHNTTIHLDALLNDLSTHFRLLASAKGIELTVAVAGQLTVFVDKDLLLLIVQNLLSNAIKYSPKGKVALKAELNPAGKVRISVSDNGPGIAPERVANLFKPFTRGETHGQEGVGLGLSIARQAADLIGASISVDSKPGGGSVFSIDLG